MTTSSIRWMAVCGLAAIVAGCSGGQGYDSESEVFTVSVTLAGEPIEDVRVVLLAKEDRTGPVLLEGISAHNGVAGMIAKNGDDPIVVPSEFVVTCESLGDWQIVAPWSNAEKSPLTITWEGDNEMTVDLPKKAVRSL